MVVWLLALLPCSKKVLTLTSQSGRGLSVCVFECPPRVCVRSLWLLSTVQRRAISVVRLTADSKFPIGGVNMSINSLFVLALRQTSNLSGVYPASHPLIMIAPAPLPPRNSINQKSIALRKTRQTVTQMGYNSHAECNSCHLRIKATLYLGSPKLDPKDWKIDES